MHRFVRLSALGGTLLCVGLGGCRREAPVLEDVREAELRQLIAGVEQDRLMNTVEELSAKRLTETPVDCHRWNNVIERFCRLTRNTGLEHLERSMQELGLQVERHSIPGEEHDVTNAVADIPGTTRPDEVVVVGAHFDAFWGGADDNSTGVAALIEMARLLSRHRFDRTLRFVGFDLEEFGAVGSSRFVAARKEDETRVATVVLDCIGYASDEPGSQVSMPGLPSSSRGDFLAIIGNDESALMASQLNALNKQLGVMKVIPLLSSGTGLSPLGEPLLRSDHAPFWAAGEPAVFLTDTASFRNPHYHLPSDLPGTLTPGFFRQSVQLTTAAVAWWAGGPR
jgi:Zn-dependent M28 family amino/carboxypeptidase